MEGENVENGQLHAEHAILQYIYCPPHQTQMIFSWLKCHIPQFLVQTERLATRSGFYLLIHFVCIFNPIINRYSMTNYLKHDNIIPFLQI